MVEFVVRKTLLLVEETLHENGPPPATPRRKAAMLAVVRNPFAGKFEPDLESAMDDLKPLGAMMTDRLIAALGDVDAIDGYGKGAIVGENGELEHGALWHVPGGYAMREKLGEAAAIVPSCKKVGGCGARIDIPLGHINAAYVRSHFDGMEVGLADAPRADEIVFVLAMACGPRIQNRMGGLEAKDVKGEDGLR